MSVPAFIDLSEADQISELQQYFKSKNIEVKEEGVLFNDVKQLIISTAELWKDTEGKDIEGVVNSILSLLFVIPIDKGCELVDLLCEQLLRGAESGKAPVSLNLLHNLFHGYPTKTPFLCKVYSTWLKLAKVSRSIHLVPTNLKELSSWLEDWNAGEEGRQNVLRLLYEAQLNCGRNKEAAETMITLLQSYTEENAGKAREDAIRCITKALADPNTYLFNQLLTLKPVTFLEGEPLHDLLNIFVSGNIKEYKDFYETNKEFIESIGLSHTSNTRKMQLLTLVDNFGSAREISFDDIIARLDISEDDVEEFIIDAIQSKLMRGRIDHVNRKVIVSQACQRIFGRAQWESLASRLEQWRDNINRVNGKLQTLQV
uniref:Eukaryotic translation initiation factor 3 subunit M n=1 Tax=Ciona intestinalis TaxID=7719 RepID=F6W248_CIOIN|nr:eukaryotic translation initiation factor 3 subunit M-like [Ciona intestinalis]|eukprot:XP_002130111.1 eukaryotic translation initiation factor 3 subunit M-like [Ciona intestinalis]